MAERANRTIVKMARSMIRAQRLGHEFWAEVVCNVMYVHNRYSTKAVNGKTLEEVWSTKMPHICHIQVFGCVAYVKVPDERRTKLDAKVSNVCFLDIAKAPRRITSFSWRQRKSSKVRTWCFSKTKHIWKIVQMGELTKHPWLRWTYLPNRTWTIRTRVAMFRNKTKSPTWRRMRRPTYRPRNSLITGSHRNLTMIRTPQPNHLPTTIWQ